MQALMPCAAIEHFAIAGDGAWNRLLARDGMLDLSSQGRRENGLIVWRSGRQDIEFTESEFEELILALRRERLFDLLLRSRPALRDQLIALFGPDLAEEGLELEDFQNRLETALLDLAARLDGR
ncbi:MAG: hypothetical protein K1X75_08360 [Leptospirales bacterium]|nr:hypothetical protein [Leptospirales bacterium]